MSGCIFTTAPSMLLIPSVFGITTHLFFCQSHIEYFRLSPPLSLLLCFICWSSSRSSVPLYHIITIIPLCTIVHTTIRLSTGDAGHDASGVEDLASDDPADWFADHFRVRDGVTRNSEGSSNQTDSDGSLRER
uniref:Uncharacterized protein 13J3.08 n=1 Tax=Trypanosoma brucei TaxID=5691 RepID=Q8WPU3_9TRYP|nr:hypothetical protein [Trypanosoma brucei]